MGDETSHNTMNLDLNLGPVVHPTQDDEPETMNLEDWLGGPAREAIGHRTRARQRWRSVWRPVPVPMEDRSFTLDLTSGTGIETGEGSVADDENDERPPEVIKTCDNCNGYLRNEAVGDKEDLENKNGGEGNFFDCNICLELASDPVVTCCGHLFCWACLYRWLHIHSNSKECPICKGEVTIKTVTPIYGRGNRTNVKEEDPNLKIPQRPQAKRVESWRQTIQNNPYIPMEEMVRRFEGRFDPIQDLVHVYPLTSDNPLDFAERRNALLSRILTSRAIRREQNTSTPNLSDSTRNLPQGSAENAALSAFLARRANQGGGVSNFPSALSSTETYGNERNQEQPPLMEDRDSMSSIAAMDTALEIDSRVSLSTYSRRRNESLRALNADNGDSRAPRRRRLH